MSASRVLAAAALLALALPPGRAGALQFTSSFKSIKAQARPGDVVTRRWQLRLAPGQPRARFRAKVEDWWQSEDGEQSFYRAPGTLGRSCGPWITLNPVESLVEPGGTLVVQLTATVPLAARPGGYWCALTVNQLTDPLADSSVGLQFVSSISTGIFLFLEPVVRQVQITTIDVSARQAIVTVRNTGNAPVGIDGRVELFRAGANRPLVSAPFHRTTVLTEPIATRSLTVALPDLAALPKGRYRMRVVLDLGLDHDVGVERELMIPHDLAALGTRH